jgi:glycosyltransferase involved in cell wall biosynthesis
LLRDRPVRICIVNTFHYRRGGDSTYAFDLAALLQAHGDEVVHFAMRHPSNAPSEFESYFVEQVDYRAIAEGGGVVAKIRSFPRSLYSFEARRKFAALLDDRRPDVVHLQNFRRHLTFSIVPEARRRGIPVVMTAHDYDSICPNSVLFTRGRPCEVCKGRDFYKAVAVGCKDGKRAGSLAIALEGYFVRLMRYYDLVDVIVTPSRFAKEKIVEFGFDATKVTAIPNFVDVSRYSPTYADSGYVVCAGRLAPEKGIPVLLEALKQLPDLKVLIIGEGPSRADLEDIAVKAGLGNTEFMGYVARDRLLEIVASASFVVTPSVSPENFPYAVLEAFALGKPVVASAVGGLPEMVEDGVTGLVVEPGDAAGLAAAMKRLTADRGLAMRMGEAGRRRVETEWDAASHYRSIRALYKSLVERVADRGSQDREWGRSRY